MVRRATLSLLVTLFIVNTPSIAGITVIGDLTHERTVLPGDVYEGSITLFNNSEIHEEVKIYQTDYLFFRDGISLYGEPGEVPRTNAGWIEFSPNRIRLAPKEKQAVQYRVRVKSDPNLCGTYWSVLMIEPVMQVTPESMNEQLGIQTIMRYGIQMITHIGDSGERQLQFVETSLTEEDGKKILQVHLENVGERFLRPRLWAEFYDEMGQLIGSYEGNQFRTFPGTSVRHAIDVSPVPAGQYTTLVVADCGGDDLFGIQYAIQIE